MPKVKGRVASLEIATATSCTIMIVEDERVGKVLERDGIEKCMVI